MRKELTLEGEVVDRDSFKMTDQVTKVEKTYFAVFLKNPNKRQPALRFACSEDDYKLLSEGDVIRFTPEISLSDFPGRKVGLNCRIISDLVIVRD